MAKEVLAEVSSRLRRGLSEADIVGLCKGAFAARGITRTWYHDTLALVLVGERTVWSGSGAVYRPLSSAVAQPGDLVTIDVMPVLDGSWGDCARSFVIAGAAGEAVARGLEAERRLHERFIRTARPSMTLHDVHDLMTKEISELGYRNLDFKGNLGHSIERHRHQRRFVEPGCPAALGEVGLLAFEPHIARGGEPVGLKHEEIYYFEEDGEISCL